MPKITVYTTEPCAYCRQAKALLDSRGVAYDEINLSKDPAGRAQLVARTGMMTFPQIMIGDKLIGGWIEMFEADISGQLDALVSAA
jgi:glutaredoxin 3